MRSSKSVLYPLGANKLPVSLSTSVTTCVIVLARSSPSTHSTYPVIDSRRWREERLRKVMAQNFTDASIATYMQSSDSIDSSVCSKVLYPKPWRTTYGRSLLVGRSVGDHTRPVASSRM